MRLFDALGCAQDELMRGGCGQVGPRRQQFRKIPSDTGGSSDELATVDGNTHLSVPLVFGQHPGRPDATRQPIDPR